MLQVQALFLSRVLFDGIGLISARAGPVGLPLSSNVAINRRQVRESYICYE